MVRLLKPLEYYQQKYGTWMFGLNKLYLMMEKQHNRGQEGAGMACVNLDAVPGSEYMFRERAEGSNAITEIFGAVQKKFKNLTPEQLADFRDEVNSGIDYDGKMVVLGGDIDFSLSDVSWEPIGNGTRDGSGYKGHAFKGTFDGRGYTISGLKIDAAADDADDVKARDVVALLG